MPLATTQLRKLSQTVSRRLTTLPRTRDSTPDEKRAHQDRRMDTCPTHAWPAPLPHLPAPQAIAKIRTLCQATPGLKGRGLIGFAYLRLDVVVQHELVRMRAQPDGVGFLLGLVPDPSV